MNTYIATVQNPAVGGCYTVTIVAESYNSALAQAQSQYGSNLLYIQ